MFKNLLKHNINDANATPVDAAPGQRAASPEPGADGAALSAEESQAWRDKIVEAKSDDAALLQLAREAPAVELKLAALQALTQPESFKQAMREFRDQDKRLYRAARSRWQTIVDTRETAAEAGALIASARALLEQDVVAVNRVVELDRAWAALNAALLDASAASEFQALSTQLSERVRARGEGEQAIGRWIAAAENGTRQLTATLPGVAQGDTLPTEPEALARALLEMLGGVPDAGDSRCIEKIEAGNRALALASSVVQRAEFLRALPAPGLVDEAAEKQLVEQWRSFPEVAQAQLQSDLARRFADWRNASTLERQREHDARRAQERELSAEQKKARLAAIQRDVEAAEAAHAEGRVADLTQSMTAIENSLKPGPVNAALMQRIEILRREQQRLRDWQRWSGKQRREELVAEAQALAAAAAGKVSVKAHADAIDQLRQRWKDLDKLGGATNQTLWLTFDGALKTAYAPVSAHLEKLKAARAENLAARKQIVDGLAQAASKFFPPTAEGEISAPEAKPDWRAIARTIEEAQVAWRKLGPVEHTVPRKAQQGDKSITARYAAALQALEKPLEEAYREAVREREALITAAKALVGADGIAREAVDKVRKLQTQWQSAAKALPLPRRDENALWTSFKSSTDAVFLALDAARTARDSEANARAKAREEIIARVAALSSLSAASEIKRALAEADTAWRAAPEIKGPPGNRLDARYRAAREAASRRLTQLATHASQARFDALIAAMAVCGEREAGGNESAEVEARWNAIENLPAPWKARLEARFQGTAEAAAAPGAGSHSKSAAKTAESLPDILLNLEVACDIESPPEFLAARRELKLRALKNAMETRRDAGATPADIERWLLEAAATPRPDDVSRERLNRIIAAVRHRQRR